MARSTSTLYNDADIVIVMKNRGLEEIAADVLRCALSWDPNVRLIGNVSAYELMRLVASTITACPKCGASAWVNIDCDLCMLLSNHE